MPKNYGIAPFVIPAVFIAFIGATGCRQDPTSYGVTESESHWTVRINDPDATPGIHAAAVTFITLQAGPPKGVPFVVWSDLPNGGSGSGGGKAGGASYKGHHRATDGRRVEFHAETTDGRAGTITIATVSYDLAKGALFLVSTQQDPPTVEQVDFDLSNFPKGKDQLIKLAESNEDIRGFFEEHSE